MMDDKEIREVFDEFGLLNKQSEKELLYNSTYWRPLGQKPIYWLITDNRSDSDVIDQINRKLTNAKLERFAT